MFCGICAVAAVVNCFSLLSGCGASELYTAPLMELRHLRYFVAVAESGQHLARGAEVVHRPAAFVAADQAARRRSRRAAALLRYPRGVRLSPAGETFLAEAKDILQRADRAMRLARQTDNAAGGVVRIGYVPTAGHNHFAAADPPAARTSSRMRHRSQRNDHGAAGSSLAWPRNRRRTGAPRRLKPVRVVAATKLSDPFCLAIPCDHPLAGGVALDLKAAAQSVFISVTRQRGAAYFDQTVGLCTDIGFTPEHPL